MVRDAVMQMLLMLAEDQDPATLTVTVPRVHLSAATAGGARTINR